MLSRYSHVRMEAKRRALDGIAALRSPVIRCRPEVVPAFRDSDRDAGNANAENKTRDG